MAARGSLPAFLALLLAAYCLARMEETPMPITDRDPEDEAEEGLCPVCIARARERMRRGSVPAGIGRLGPPRGGQVHCGACGETLWRVRAGRAWSWLRWAAG